MSNNTAELYLPGFYCSSSEWGTDINTAGT